MSDGSRVSSERRPKVMRAIARLNVGGPARHAVILEHGLRARGFDTLLVHGTPTSDEGSLLETAIVMFEWRTFPIRGSRLRRTS